MSSFAAMKARITARGRANYRKARSTSRRSTSRRSTPRSRRLAREGTPTVWSTRPGIRTTTRTYRTPGYKSPAVKAQEYTQKIRDASLDAMRETQRRAAEDRAAAMREITTGRERSLTALGTGETRGAGELTGARERALGMYGGAEELFRQMQAEPEAISDRVAGQMYEKGRIGIEAGTQAGQRRLSRAYMRGGAPGGAMLREMSGVRESGIGQLSGLQRDIAIERAKRKRQDMLALMGKGMELGGAKAGIVSQSGRSLADLYSGMARSRAGAHGTAGRSLSQLYGHTLAKVPTF